MPLRRRVLIVGTSTYLVALAVVGLWPQHVDQEFNVVEWPPVRAVIDLLGIGGDTAYVLIESGANLLWFVPFGVLVATTRRRRPLLAGLVAGFVVSGAIELAQLLFRPERTASLADVAVNTLGAGVGAAVTAWWSSRRRDRTPARSAL